MRQVRSRFITLLGGAALSLVLVACGSGGYGGKAPQPQPGTMPPPNYPPPGAAQLTVPHAPAPVPAATAAR